MTHSDKLVRTLVAALAVTALAVPAAHAGPLHEPDSPAAATRPSDRGSSTREQDLRHQRAGADIDAPLPGPPTWPTHPQPITQARTVHDRDPAGPDWTTVALGLAGACLVVGGAAAIAQRTRGRTARTRVAA
jgi:hypothetical protein